MEQRPDAWWQFTAVELTIAGALAVAALLAARWKMRRRVRQRRPPRAAAARPAVLCWKGAIIPAALDEQQVSECEVLAALRAHGLSSVADAEAVVLDSDGTIRVIGWGVRTAARVGRVDAARTGSRFGRRRQTRGDLPGVDGEAG